ncbi:hypothetical protein ACIF8T_23130 [Streptomyces sp. NPDC085946]|uniref:hypothetical protein n=1 Tax=Streptomyces sp. NPDC085946 TaxID=3365744 RepID=UPI0037D17CB0
MHRAARAPVLVSRRHVVLPGLDDGPVLVLFSAHGGLDDVPEGCIEVNPPGGPGRPWKGMPSPVGSLELRGRPDDAPTVVPLAGGRPLWPRRPYERLDPDDPQDRDYLAALTGQGQP